MTDFYKKYYEDHIFRYENITNPVELKRIQQVIDMVPGNVTSVLDVGCGDGRIANRLKNKFKVYGCDLSFKTLSYLEIPVLQSLISSLPFKKQAVDLSLCSEVIEHLPDDILISAVQELKDISRKYILLSTPYTYNLNYQRVVCPRCKTQFNGWGHLQSFSIQQIEQLFGPAWKIEKYQLCRDSQLPYANWLLNIKQKLGGYWYWSENLLCPNCGNVEFPQPKKNIISILCNILNRFMFATPKSYWLIVLLKTE